MFTPVVIVSRTLTTAVRCKRRVVVTGIGIVCPLGIGAQNAWQALINSKSGITKLSKPEYEKLPCRVGKSFIIFNFLKENLNNFL